MTAACLAPAPDFSAPSAGLSSTLVPSSSRSLDAARRARRVRWMPGWADGRNEGWRSLLFLYPRNAGLRRSRYSATLVRHSFASPAPYFPDISHCQGVPDCRPPPASEQCHLALKSDNVLTEFEEDEQPVAAGDMDLVFHQSRDARLNASCMYPRTCDSLRDWSHPTSEHRLLLRFTGSRAPTVPGAQPVQPFPTRCGRSTTYAALLRALFGCVHNRMCRRTYGARCRRRA